MLTAFYSVIIYMLKVLVTGSSGQVGSELRELCSLYPQYNFTFVDRSILDMSRPQTFKNYFNSNHFNAIINCAAYTAVDKAESEQDLADLVNHLAVAEIAEIAKMQNATFIHISTDYVFDGKHYRAYNEDSKTNPASIYGKTKLAGETAILRIAPKKSIIIRTSWVYSSFGNNFIKTMLRLGRERENIGVIFDQVGSPTYAKDLARTILEILPKIKNAKPQIYHYSNEGVISWFDLAHAIFDLSEIQCNVKALTTEEYPTIAPRPHNSQLNKNKIKKEFDIAIPYWRNSLKECLTKIKNS